MILSEYKACVQFILTLKLNLACQKIKLLLNKVKLSEYDDLFHLT